MATVTFDLTGYLHDAIAGTAVAGATVTAYPHADANPAAGSLGSTTTDANGKFVIPTITAQQVDIQITNGGQTYWWKGALTMSMGTLYIDRVLHSVTNAGNVPVKLLTADITPDVTTLVTFGAALSLTQAFKHLKLVGSLRWGVGSLFTNQLSMRFNADAGASNYEIQDDVTSPPTAPSTGSSARLGLAPNTGLVGKHSLVFEAIIYNYADANLYKTCNVFASVDLGSLRSEITSNVWKSVAPITQIDVSDFAGSYKWGAGSNLQLWGIP